MEAVQDIRQHPYCSTYGHSQHHDITLFHALLITDHSINQSDLLSSSSINRLRLNSEYLVGEAFPFQVDGHRSTDQS